MNKRKVYLGPNDNSMKEQLQNLALDYLHKNKGDRFFYLLPNRELLTNYRNEFIDKLGVALDMNFITFDDIVMKITEGKVIKLASDPIKKIVLRKVLKDLEKKGLLNYYKSFTDYNGFVESCIYIIGVIKRSLITSDQYLLNCPDSSFYREIGLVYEEYDKELNRQGYADKDGLYLESINLLKNNKDFLHDLDFIIIDEFYDFRPIELEIINLLKDLDIDIYINIPFQIENQNKRLDETTNALTGLGFEIVKIFKNNFKEFEQLGQILFDNGEKKVEANIELIKASSMYLEIKKILKVIKNNYRNKAMGLNDNCICTFNNEYINMIFKVAKEEKLPIAMDYSIPLKSLPLTREIISLIEFTIYSGDKEIFLNRLKSAYLSLSNKESRDRLEYILRKANFYNIEDLWKMINENKSMDIAEKYRDEIKDIILHLKDELSSLKGKHTLEEFNEKLLFILKDYSIEEKIVDRFKINENYQLFQRDLSNLKTIMDILLNMDATYFSEDKIDLDEYLMILLDYFEEEKIIEIKANPNGIKIITIDNARGIEYRKVFITGLSQGTYPNLGMNSFFFSDDNYHVLKDIGIDVKNYKNRLDNEILKFVSLISSCREKLYISCNFNPQEDENPLYSIFLDEILDKLSGEKHEDKLKVKEIDLEFLYSNPIQDITSNREFSYKVFNDYYNENVDSSLLKYHNSMNEEKVNNINLQLEAYIERYKKEFNSYSGRLEKFIPKEYMTNELSHRKISVSFIENYSICPYAFLLSNVFNIEELEREKQDYDPRVNGTIYHEVLRIYYEKYKDDFSRNHDFDYSASLEFLEDILLKEAEKANYSLSSKNDSLLIQDMLSRLKKFIEEDMKRLKKSKGTLPWSFEEEFNMDFNIDKNRLMIKGIIDRIDKTSDDKYIIIDYKTSEYGKRTIKDIENKTSLQLPIYILSQSHRNVVAGFYGVIKSGKFHNGIGLLGESNLISKKQSGAIDRVRWDEILQTTKVTIGEIVKGIWEGNFSVNPRECSPYCIYKDICRYDKVQEVEE